MTKLSEADVQDRLDQMDAWSEINGAIQRTFQFKDFVEAIEFVGKIAECAEEVQHHPDILIRYNKVTLTLSTHDASGITGRDFDFAAQADAWAG